MKIEGVAFSVTDWSAVPSTEHPGATGTAHWRAFEAGNLRVRMVEYAPGYAADHWCSRGHVLLVLGGEIVTELRDGRRFVLREGSSYQASDLPAEAHRSSSPKGARLFIVD
jgi:quercetin dioxygenase-like cupin family protein